MTKAEIIAELRRSAVEDENPAFDSHHDAWRAADKYWHDDDDCSLGMKYRMWFLIVACALEDA